MIAAGEGFMRSRYVLVLAVLGVLFIAGLASACPNCVDSIAENGSTGDTGGAGSMAAGVGGSMAEGYYYSILFMITMLFSVTGAIICVIWRQARADARALAADPAHLQ
jgi:hypothetical protein